MGATSSQIISLGTVIHVLGQLFVKDAKNDPRPLPVGQKVLKVHCVGQKSVGQFLTDGKTAQISKNCNLQKYRNRGN